jgi:dihydroxy-acid dehydratase
MLLISETEMSERRRLWRPPGTVSGGLLEKYALSVRSASVGAVTHGGAVYWPEDIVDET